MEREWWGIGVGGEANENEEERGEELASTLVRGMEQQIVAGGIIEELIKLGV